MKIDLWGGTGRGWVLGRRRECEALDALIADVGERQGRAMVLRGEPGIGKTALLDHVQAQADGFRVLRASGVEFETELAFAALHQLTAPLLDRRDQLPEPQREALETAFGLSAGKAADRFLVGLAMLGLLSEVAADQPLLCIIDDAQWLDQASAQALGLVGRRIAAEPVLLVFALREERPELHGLPELPISGLSEADARALLASEIHAPLDARVRDRVIGEARGNPLALLELPRSATPADLAGGFTAQPVREKIERSFLERLGLLPAQTRALMRVAAAEPVGDPVLLWRAAGSLGIPAEAVVPAQTAGLMDVGTRVRFRHPLVRSAVYGSASPAERSEAHRALAEATDPVHDADRLAWHRGQAAAGPDEDVATELEASADRARARGGVAAVAAFLELAAALTPDPERRVNRALDAAQAKRDAGAAEAALTLLTVAEAGPVDDRLRARIETMRAQITFEARRDGAAIGLLLQAARLADPPEAREIILEALAVGLFAGRFGSARQIAAMAVDVLERSPAPDPSRPADLLLDALIARVTDGYATALPLLRQAVGAYLSADEQGIGWLRMVGGTTMDLWDDGSWHALGNKHAGLARESGAIATLPVALNIQAVARLHAGAFNEAAGMVEEAYTVTAAIGGPPITYADLFLSAWRGDEARTLRLVEGAVKGGTARGEGRIVSVAEHVQAVLFNSLGRYDAAMEACRALSELDELGFVLWTPPEFLEAAARSGRHDLAVPVLARFQEHARASGSDLAVGLELRARALLSDGDEGLYREAIDCLAQSGGYLARAQLVYGEWLRREGRRADARTALRTAHESFVSMGAEAFAARAARELRATGEHASRGDARALDQLTAQELNIARLVASGGTSKEVGSQLFLSPRTIDAHLRNIFKKLGLTSRRQLKDVRL